MPARAVLRTAVAKHVPRDDPRYSQRIHHIFTGTVNRSPVCTYYGEAVGHMLNLKLKDIRVLLACSAEAIAAEHGITVREFVTRALNAALTATKPGGIPPSLRRTLRAK